jgi:hypothetical protein
MSFTALDSVKTTHQKPVGSITVRAGQMPHRNSFKDRRKAIYIEKTDTQIDLTQIQVAPNASSTSALEAPRPATMPPLEVRLNEEDSEAVLYPVVPMTSLRPVSPTIARVPHQRLRNRASTLSLPPELIRPLSDGPLGHAYTPVLARPRYMESFGPIERFEQPSVRLSMISLVSSICSEEAANTRSIHQVFTYTPNAEHAITQVQKVKWYKKGAERLKKMFTQKNR